MTDKKHWPISWPSNTLIKPLLTIGFSIVIYAYAGFSHAEEKPVTYSCTDKKREYSEYVVDSIIREQFNGCHPVDIIFKATVPDKHMKLGEVILKLNDGIGRNIGSFK